MAAIKGKENRDEERIFLPLRMFPAKFIYIFKNRLGNILTENLLIEQKRRRYDGDNSDRSRVQAGVWILMAQVANLSVRSYFKCKNVTSFMKRTHLLLSRTKSQHALQANNVIKQGTTEHPDDPHVSLQRSCDISLHLSGSRYNRKTVKIM